MDDQYPELSCLYPLALRVLESDLWNLRRQRKQKKLEGVAPEGSVSLATRRFRFRYDISGRDVVLRWCGLRREES